MTASLINAAHLARDAITCFLTHCAIEEDETTFPAYYKARIADKALSEAFDDLANNHAWVIRELKYLIDKKRLRAKVAQLELKIEEFKLQVTGLDGELAFANSLLLERQREIDELRNLAEKVGVDLAVANDPDAAQDMAGKSIDEIAGSPREWLSTRAEA